MKANYRKACNEDNSYYYNPVKFIDALKNHKHIVLLYEDREMAKKIEYRFIKNGLGKGQHCIYTTTHGYGDNNDNDDIYHYYHLVFDRIPNGKHFTDRC
jgi:hypothetical protein